ncbi:hypothetical protein [Amycolatopsis sp. GM8]|uniref:hypothetical protein n=1 Tax=Amycolatopsis sp. GM8 TaxID=2896530 RepID=UPI001F18AA2B|nr:hypothetical protein [Amycolatopsis sp. GM8]
MEQRDVGRGIMVSLALAAGVLVVATGLPYRREDHCHRDLDGRRRAAPPPRPQWTLSTPGGHGADPARDSILAAQRGDDVALDAALDKVLDHCGR